jgi:hypothetical protein
VWVFKLTPNSNGGWAETKLYNFHNFGAAGNLYGTTSGYINITHGSVFEITP